MKVFIVLEWFHEGDSYLVNSFIGVKSTYEEAKSLLDEGDIILKEEEFEVSNEERTPKETRLWNGYGDGSKFEIREVEL